MYELAHCEIPMGDADQVIGPFNSRDEVLAELQKKTNPDGALATKPREWYWARWNEIPRKENCVVVKP